MKIIATAIPEVLIIEPTLFCDERGYFFESFSQKAFLENAAQTLFVQDNESFSHRGVVRGIHFQTGVHAQSKLVRVIEGTILDVVVDLRRGSPSFGKHVSAILSGANKHQLFIPRGFGHGFSVLSETATVQYKCDNYYAPGHEGSIRWDDPTLGIDWQMEHSQAIVSGKDGQAPLLADAPVLFEYKNLCDAK